MIAQEGFRIFGRDSSSFKSLSDFLRNDTVTSSILSFWTNRRDFDTIIWPKFITVVFADIREYLFRVPGYFATKEGPKRNQLSKNLYSEDAADISLFHFAQDAQWTETCPILAFFTGSRH